MSGDLDEGISSSKYKTAFRGKEGRAFEVALEARRFEIQMYWTRTAYFWTISAAALAGFFALEAQDKVNPIYPFSVSCIGAVLALGWGLANKGSKYWHENWEHHVQLLEDSIVGPLHKTLVYRPAEPLRMRRDFFSQVLTGPAEFSVSKINSIFSWFFFVVWLVLVVLTVPKAAPCAEYVFDYRYALMGAVSIVFAIALLWLGRSWLKDQEHWARAFRGRIVRKNDT
ncbi:hypothetical protein [Pseudoxanthomonas mexicana]|uniref:RipA family octameric membrane protein n=1 Tax=Pseudoxanthomonas mexicana TaxID=128785 RepID=UPI0022F3FDD7|nr:hypothetical protein [Pseudoxanthomonas mexicana]WBX93385.1 hypothetical protein PE064_17160 [Pseudoxanthomonas mexicana]